MRVSQSLTHLRSYPPKTAIVVNVITSNTVTVCTACPSPDDNVSRPNPGFPTPLIVSSQPTASKRELPHHAAECPENKSIKY